MRSRHFHSHRDREAFFVTIEEHSSPIREQMIREVKIQNYKSIESLDLELGRVNVLIGENGCGKTNILEAIALASAAYSDKLDNEFLVSRGIRVTAPQLMRSAFDKENVEKDIEVEIILDDSKVYSFLLTNDNQMYSKWKIRREHSTQYIITKNVQDELRHIAQQLELGKLTELSNAKSILYTVLTLDRKPEEHQQIAEDLDKKFNDIYDTYQKNKHNKERNKLTNNLVIDKYSFLSDFFIFCPNNSSLRIFEEEGQIQPLGIHGEGLFRFLRFLDMQEDKTRFNEIKERLRLISWFKDFEIPKDLFGTERKMYITDKYLDRDLKYFDQRSSNEGFLFTLFYLALFVGEETPKFFAIDNIDNALNPKLCWRVVEELVELAKKYDKQVIFTTHNPAVLDGLDLDDDEQRLFVISRNKFGRTRSKRIFSPKKIEGQEPLELSEAFMRGYIGGMPQHF